MVQREVGEAGEVGKFQDVFTFVFVFGSGFVFVFMFQVGRGDMACDGDWLVMGCQTGVAWSKVGQELMQLNTEEVLQVGLIPLDRPQSLFYLYLKKISQPTWIGLARFPCMCSYLALYFSYIVNFISHIL